MSDHCPACQIVRELAEHRDQAAPAWGLRRGVLNFALIVARRACTAYVPTQTPNTEETTS